MKYLRPKFFHLFKVNIREYIYYRKQQKKKLNAIFDEVKNEPDDGLVEVSFEIDQEVFEQAKKICDDMEQRWKLF